MDGEGDTDAFHLRKFKCFPPGDFPGAYVSSRAAKEVAKAPKWSRRASRASTFSTWDRPLYRGEAARGATQESREHRVSFADGPGPLSTRRAAEDPRGAKDGTGGRHRSSASQEANQLAIVKKEVEVIPSESEKEDKKKKKKASKLSNTLARAAQLRNAVDQREATQEEQFDIAIQEAQAKAEGSSGSDSDSQSSVELPRATNPWWPRSSGEA